VLIFNDLLHTKIFNYVQSFVGVHSASWVQLRSYLEGKVAAPVQKAENTAAGNRRADHATPSIRKELALTSSTSGSRSVSIVCFAN
jgi:hypothetical protein